MARKSSACIPTAVLSDMSTDELRSVARKLRLSGYSGLKKSELVDLIVSTAEPDSLRNLLFPTWWSKHSNHVYGVIGVIGLLVTVFAYIQQSRPAAEPTRTSPAQNPSEQPVHAVEYPIKLRDYAELTPAERLALFTAREGEIFVWEGYVLEAIGFKLESIYGVELEKDVGIRITPARSPAHQLSVECHFGKLLGGDADLELASRLQLLDVRQRVRLSGQLSGKADAPVLRNAVIEAVFPVDG